MRVLTWNLFHGRSLPPAPGGELLRCFAGLLAAWEWDLALLQEVPPWWPPALARAAHCEERHVLTSRNAPLALRRALARRRPELMKSNGGGCNAVLARGAITEHRRLPLRRWPERRVAQLVALKDGTCAANYHASTRVPLAEQELERLWQAALEWADGRPLILGGDLNLRKPSAPSSEISHVASRDVDHLFARGLAARAEARLLERRVELRGASVELSDHPPLLVELVAPDSARS